MEPATPPVPTLQALLLKLEQYVGAGITGQRLSGLLLSAVDQLLREPTTPSALRLVFERNGWCYDPYGGYFGDVDGPRLLADLRAWLHQAALPFAPATASRAPEQALVYSVFWDIENAQIPHGIEPSQVVARVRALLPIGATQVGFACYVNPIKLSARVRESLDRCGINVVDVPHSKPNAADRKIQQAIEQFKDANRPPAIIVLISGDGDFAARLHDLRNLSYSIYLLHHDTSAPELLAAANVRHIWRSLFTDPATTATAAASPPAPAATKSAAQQVKPTPASTVAHKAAARAPPGFCRTFWDGQSCPAPCGFQHRLRDDGQPRPTAAPPTMAPAGMCRQAWNAEPCLRWKCKFSHSRPGLSSASPAAAAPPSSAPATASATTPAPVPVATAAPPPGQLRPFHTWLPHGDFKHQHDIRRFLRAALTLAKLDVAELLQALGDAKRREGPDLLRALVKHCAASRIDAHMREKLVSFQRVSLLLLHLVTLPVVCNSTLKQYLQLIFTILDDADFIENIIKCTRDLQQHLGSWPSPSEVEAEDDDWAPTTWAHVGGTVAEFFVLLLTRTSHVPSDDLCLFVTRDLPLWVPHAGSELRHRASHLMKIVERRSPKTAEALPPSLPLVRPARPPKQMAPAARAALAAAFEGPGDMRAAGRRHDNDFRDIGEISTVPTQQEVLCPLPPYLPQNAVDAMHHLGEISWLRHVDTHFRLLRHDMLASLSEGLTAFLAAAYQQWHARPSGQRFSVKGGSTDLCVYTGVRLESIVPMKEGPRGGLAFYLRFTALQATASLRSKREREDFWARSKRLMQGSLACLLHWSAAAPSLIFVRIAGRDPKKLSADDGPQLQIAPCLPHDIRACFRLLHDPGANLLLLHSKGGYYEAYVPVLEALKELAKTGPPGGFDQYLVPRRLPSPLVPDPPEYLVPGETTFDLSTLQLKDPARAALFKAACARTPVCSDRLREVLLEFTTLDAAQAAALQLAISREVGLIQGPPGTGKTFLGIHLARILLRNIPRAAPLLTVCYTNHALDQFLEGLKKNGIDNIVRIGAGSKSEDLQSLNLREMEDAAKTVGDKRRIRAQHAEIEKIAREIARQQELLEALRTKKTPPFDDLLQSVIERTAPHLLLSILARRGADEDHELSAAQKWKGWLKEGRPVKSEKPKQATASSDKAAPQQGNAFSALGEEEFETVRKSIAEILLGEPQNVILMSQLGPRLKAMGVALPAKLKVILRRFPHFYVPPVGLPGTEIVTFASGYGPAASAAAAAPPPPPVVAAPASPPQRALTLDEALAVRDASALPLSARLLLARHWATLAAEGSGGPVERLERLSLRFMEEQEKLQAVYDDVRLRVLRKAHVVGVTTSGAAKNLPLLSALGAQIVICEEAAEVMEAHLLACLSQQTRHLILIGDHLQLRPKVERHELTCEAGGGFRLDLSLFERLASDQRLQLATLATQWRMRPEISAIPRAMLYPSLLDAPAVARYESVLGMRADLWFFDHRRLEDNSAKDSGESSHSKSHTWECEMILAFLLHLQRQGYRRHDIAILTPYLGQLAKLRTELQKRKVDVKVSEQDEEELQKVTAEEPGAPKEEDRGVATTTMREFVRLASVDNFQGEESDIVIISLVRSNPQASIGFLKIANRVNVLLTRAKKGMYIFGNAACLEAKPVHRGLAKNPWLPVLALLRQNNQIGPYLPLRCEVHRDTDINIREPKDFDAYAREGGCRLPCGGRLPCGHGCPLPCHPTDLQHRSYFCKEKCVRAAPGCVSGDHQCKALCGSPCEPCAKAVQVRLSCGHDARVPCNLSADPAKAELRVRFCTTKVAVRVKRCNHEAQVECRSADRAADAPCEKACGRALICGHACVRPCHEGTVCGDCTSSCPMTCVHSTCKAPCADPCPLCSHPCVWECEHFGPCTLPCGAPCIRPPCDQRCTRLLSCKHRCPSVCGEECPDPAFCPECGSKKDMEVDVLEFKKLGEHFADPGAEPIIVPPCGHALTITSMDGRVGLSQAYRQTQSGGYEPEPLPPNPVAPGVCWTCRAPVSRVRRYGRLLNHAWMCAAQAKYRMRTAAELTRLRAVAVGIDEEVAKAEGAAEERAKEKKKAAPAAAAAKGAKKKVDEDVVPPKLRTRLADLAAKCDRIAAAAASPVAEMHAKTAAALAALRKAAKYPAAVLAVVAPPDNRSECETALFRVELHILEIRLAVLGLATAETSDVKAEIDRIHKAATDCVFQARQRATDGNSYVVLAATCCASFALLATVARAYQALRVGSKAGSEALRAAQDEFLARCGAEVAQLRKLVATHSVVADKYAEKAKQFTADLEALQAKVKLDAVFYDTVTPEEKRAIAAAMARELGGTGGHWYNCPNGHTYSIGECGQAMQAATCPECGAVVGGGSHRLAAQNTAANEFVQEATAAGLRP